MSSQTVSQGQQGRSTPEYLTLAANLIYAVAGLLFLLGLYADWQQPGKVWISQLVITSGNTPNNGLFVLSIIVLVIGFIVSKVGEIIQARNVEKVDQTQEWTVDVSSNKR